MKNERKLFKSDIKRETKKTKDTKTPQINWKLLKVWSSNSSSCSSRFGGGGGAKRRKNIQKFFFKDFRL